ncbi:MAG: DUF4430 domain-containing protein [Thermoplasmata archaeon]|nr:MAG: DUF4430 domain-containing protein [Thermoplasmata archaeon]
MDKNKRKTALEALAFAVVLAVAFMGLWALAEYIEEADEPEPIDSPINVTLRIDYGEKMDEYHMLTLNNTVYSLLLEGAASCNFSVGYTFWPGYDAVFINAINGTQNGEGGLWWQYYVNDDYGEVGCDKKEIFEGDVVEWRFEEPGQ